MVHLMPQQISLTEAKTLPVEAQIDNIKTLIHISICYGI
jgi:hypothetical protein